MAAPNNFWPRIAQALIVGAVIGCAGGVIRNLNRISTLETHFGYIRASLMAIEKKLEKAP